jgi:hypothetical protein
MTLPRYQEITQRFSDADLVAVLREQNITASPLPHRKSLVRWRPNTDDRAYALSKRSYTDDDIRRVLRRIKKRACRDTDTRELAARTARTIKSRLQAGPDAQVQLIQRKDRTLEATYQHKFPNGQFMRCTSGFEGRQVNRHNEQALASQLGSQMKGIRRLMKGAMAGASTDAQRRAAGLRDSFVAGFRGTADARERAAYITEL